MTAIQIVKQFITCINNQDLDGLMNLLSSNHIMIIEGEDPMSGLEILRKAWAGYFSAYPKYKVFIDSIEEEQDVVTVIGHTTDSHVPKEIEANEVVQWKAKIVDTLLATWEISVLSDS